MRFWGRSFHAIGSGFDTGGSLQRSPWSQVAACGVKLGSSAALSAEYRAAAEIIIWGSVTFAAILNFRCAAFFPVFLG